MKIIVLIVFISICSFVAHAQNQFCYNVKTKALDIGVYDYSKAKKRKLKVLHEENAYEALKNRVLNGKKLNDNFLENITGWMEEQDIIAYYPTEDVVLFNCPASAVTAFNLKEQTDGYGISGDPTSYIYSPSGKYRFSTLEADGPQYYLEEKINNKYQACDNIRIGGVFYSFYWHDDNTLYYLQELTKYSDSSPENKTKYWIGYSSKIEKIKCK